MLPRIKNLLPLILIFLSSAILFYPSLNYYFFQDDWFVLNWVKNSNLLGLFKFRTDIIYWRPISMPLFFKLNLSLFGLNPLGFHAMAFLIFFLLTSVVFYLFKSFIKDTKISFIIAFLYATWSIHFISLSWLSTTSYILGPLFEIISFIFFFRKNYFLSIAAFILAIASSELAIVLPLLFLIWDLMINGRNRFKYILPFLAIDFIYLVLRFYIFPIPIGGNYQLSPSGVINNIIWYFGWALGLPESLKDLVFIRHPSESLRVLIQFWRVTIPSALLFLLIVHRLTLNFRQNSKDYLFGAAWFLVSISPVVALKDHSYPMYLSFAGLGLLFILSTAFKKAKTAAIFFLVLIWLVATKENLRFNGYVHWVVNEQGISRAYTDFARKILPHPQNGTAFIIKGADGDFAQLHNFVLIDKQNILRQSLNNQDAMQVVYTNNTLKSLYIYGDGGIDLPPTTPIREIRPNTHQ